MIGANVDLSLGMKEGAYLMLKVRAEKGVQDDLDFYLDN